MLLVVTQSLSLRNHDAFGCPDPSLSSSITEFNQSKYSIPDGNAIRVINTKSDTIFTDQFRFLTFTNSTLGFRMDYHLDWSYTFTDSSVIFRPTNEAGSIYHVHVKVGVGKNHFSYLIEPYLNFVPDEQDLLRNGSSFTVAPITISGLPAIKIQFISLGMEEGPCPPPFPVQRNMTDIYIPSGDILYSIEYDSGFRL